MYLPMRPYHEENKKKGNLNFEYLRFTRMPLVVKLPFLVNRTYDEEVKNKL